MDQIEDTLTRWMRPLYGLKRVERMFRECKQNQRIIKRFDLFSTTDGYKKVYNTNVFSSFQRTSTLCEQDSSKEEKTSSLYQHHLATCRTCMNDIEGDPFTCKNDACQIYFTRYKLKNMIGNLE